MNIKNTTIMVLVYQVLLTFFPLERVKFKPWIRQIDDDGGIMLEQVVASFEKAVRAGVTNSRPGMYPQVRSQIYGSSGPKACYSSAWTCGIVSGVSAGKYYSKVALRTRNHLG